MSSNDAGGGSGPGTGEALKIIKTQLIPHHHTPILQQHSSLPSSQTTTIPTTTMTATTTKPITTTTIINNHTQSTTLSLSNPNSTIIHNNSPHIAHLTAAHGPIQLKQIPNSFSLNPVAAKITHLKTTTIDGSGSGVASIGVSSCNTIMTSGISTSGAVKLTTAGGSIGTPIALSSAPQSSSTAIRAIGAGGQSTQVRVVMPTNIMSSSIIKQLETSGRTQITAIPASNARTVSNTSITVTRPVTQATYLPRAGVTATQMTGVSMASGQRLVTPIRATSTNAGGTTMTGLTAAGSFVRGTAVSRSNSSSPATTVISPATSTAWMTANTTGQVQLIRAIPHQSRQRIITTQSLSNAAGGTVVATTAGQAGVGQSQAHQTQGVVGSGVQSNIQVSSQGQAPHSQQQQTYVATLAAVLPQRQHQATLVYSSNVAAATSQPLTQQQQFSSSVATAQRFAVATPINATSGTGAAPRHIRPIPLGKSFSAAKLNTTSISIRAPNVPQLTPTLSAGVSGTAVVTTGANSPRSTTVSGVGATGNVIPTANLSTTRIIQLQQQPGGGTQQLIGSAGRLAGNVMLQPIIVNTPGGGKIGLRPPVTMAAKVQPSLTITQLGIGKLPAAAGGQVGQQSVVSTANFQAINTSGGNSGSTAITAASTSNAVGVTTTNISNATPTTQLINVSQAGANSSTQILTTQNIVSSSGGGTVVPLAITTRGSAAGNILTGTITPIKNATGITVGKVMTHAAHAQMTHAADGSSNNNNNSNNAANQTAGATSVYIHQRTHNVNSATVTPVVTTGGATVNAANTVLTSAASAVGGNSSTATSAFLPPGSTIYYESVPASSVQVSTGVLSLSTTTVTSSTMSQNQIVSSASNLAISALPFATHAGNSTATFTVVPSTGGRTIGQLQIPVSSATGTQIQAVPVRFSAQLGAATGNANASDSTISVSSAQLLQGNVTGAGGGGTTQQILIPTGAHHHAGNAAGQQQQQTQHMVIPLQTSIKVTSGGTAGTALVSNFLRKRDADGSPVRAAKNLGPTLLSMGAASTSNIGSPAPSSVSSTFSIASATASTSSSAPTSSLTVEALVKKDRAAAAASAATTFSAITSTRTSRAESPASSDGSTTVSANSSPGVEQQMQDGHIVINRMPGGTSDATHFNPINELYSTHHSAAMQQHSIGGTPASSRNSSLDHHQQIHGGISAASSTQRLNGGPIDCLPRKKSRRSTNDSQHSIQSQASLSLPPPTSHGNINNNHDATMLSAAAATAAGAGGNDGNNAANNINHKQNNNVPPTTGNKENAKPVEYVLRRPRSCTLLNTYKQNWKAANNHFQRYSDIKPREERRPTVIDFANQSNVLGTISGWKIYHLCSQMEDLCENESLGYEKLSTMLKQMETLGKNPEIERINDLLKGNMQRSKIIVDGVNEAQNQIMKIFEHKSHISDIINRCASKRNFKKREKV